MVETVVIQFPFSLIKYQSQNWAEKALDIKILLILENCISFILL